MVAPETPWLARVRQWIGVISHRSWPGRLPRHGRPEQWSPDPGLPIRADLTSHPRIPNTHLVEAACGFSGTADVLRALCRRRASLEPAGPDRDRYGRRRTEGAPPETGDREG